MAARSTAWVCARSLVGIMGSNPARGMDVCRKFCVMCGYRRLGRLSRGVVPSVSCLSVIAEPREGGGQGLLGLSSHEKNIIKMY